VLFGAQALGSSIGPFLGGLVADSFGLTATFHFLAGTIVAANLFILFMPGTEAAKE
jgi:predicted MFS family arabinose efflux permease